ncbi:MAG: LysR substrate-binding domain-containing protein [Paracoccaceae bacterium]|nr:LysR substrate-binding domain-containing protein [Paracoccaceae bacterium]
MDIRQLRYFITIVEQGSFSAAAAVLNVAQPALSIHLRNMEAALGLPLLLRGPQGVVPTEAGQVLLQRARLIVDTLASAQQDILSLGTDPAGEVRLGLPATISGIIAVPLITQARKRFPRIKITIAEAMSGFVNEWLMQGRLDFAVLYSQIAQRGVQWSAMVREELVMICPNLPADDLASSMELSQIGGHRLILPSGSHGLRAMLSDAPLILPSGAHGLRAMLDRAAEAEGVTLAPEIEIDSYHNIIALVVSGMGASVLPYHAVAAEAEKGLLRIRHFSKPTLWRQAHLAHLTSRPMTRAAEAIGALLREVVVELVQSGVWAGAKLVPPDAQNSSADGLID